MNCASTLRVKGCLPLGPAIELPSYTWLLGLISFLYYIYMPNYMPYIPATIPIYIYIHIYISPLYQIIIDYPYISSWLSKKCQGSRYLCVNCDFRRIRSPAFTTPAPAWRKGNQEGTAGWTMRVSLGFNKNKCWLKQQKLGFRMDGNFDQQKCRGGIQPRNHQPKPTMLGCSRGPETGVYSGRAGVDARQYSADKHMT